jgi:hypothetical protein
MATSRYMGLLAGPALGAGFLLAFGAVNGLLLNAALYLPLLLWLWKAPYGPKFRAGEQPTQSRVRGFADIIQPAQAIASDRVIVSMILLAGAASLFISNAYQAQMPEFARDLGHGDPSVSYSALLGAARRAR